MGHVIDGLCLAGVLRLRCKKVLEARGRVEEVIESSKPVGFERVVVLKGQVEVAVILGVLGQLAIYYWRRRSLRNDNVYIAGSLE